MTDNSAPGGAAQRRYHDRAADAVLTELHATAQGLSAADAAARLARHGPNQLPAPPRPSALRRFLGQFHNILIYVLLGSAAITALLGHGADTAVILAVVVINAIIGYLQEGKAEKAMDAIRGMLAPRAAVLRNGERHSIVSEELVPGDIVLLEAGDRVPADLRLIRAHGLSIQEAILTGESVPVDKTVAPVAPDAPLGDRDCLAFSGTLVTAGQARGVVVATGRDTEIGRVSGLLADVATLTTPLVAQMNVFAKWLTFVILGVSAALLAYGYAGGRYPFADLFMVVVGLAVAAIPEGLPAVLTITLAVGVQAMARRNAIVRRLPAIETLGSVSVICTDKTGTLTRNEMMVATLATAEGHFRVSGDGYAPEGELWRGNEAVDGDQLPAMATFALAATLCNDAALVNRNGDWLVEGDPMEGALLALAGKLAADWQQLPARWTRTDAIPFDAAHRFMATLNHDHNNHAFVFVKGAPERILAMCASQRTADGDTAALDLPYWHGLAEEIAGQGQRVLAFAARAVPIDKTVLEFADVEGGLTLLGLVGLMDPPRPEAIAAVAECHAAGISVKMITGDHVGTAAAIGRQIGLTRSDRVLTGADLDTLDDAALKAAVMDCDIYARTSPEHKLRLVMALQAHQLTVAMTGDGVNDAPALKRADAGIAMGMKGTEAAKEASQLVLADDNFASIAAAIREGRTVYDNIKKVISWTLPTGAGEAMTLVVALLFGMSLPITPVQILWVNLITAVTLGLALAFEPTEENTMRRPPRPRGQPLLDGELLWHIALVSLLFLAAVFGMYSWGLQQGYAEPLARTLAVNMLVVLEIFHLFFIRNIYGTSLTWQAVRGTPVVWATVVIIVVAQFAITYVPILNRIFGTAPVSFLDGLLIVALGAVFFALIECEKQVRLRAQARRAAPQA